MRKKKLGRRGRKKKKTRKRAAARLREPAHKADAEVQEDDEAAERLEQAASRETQAWMMLIWYTLAIMKAAEEEKYLATSSSERCSLIKMRDEQVILLC